ncbi:CCAAT/enhancer-binding protein zeta-like [Varroa jacobsoni]|uniref:CCAAT/enhancer-binding protein zeta-like n=1 Tax=Varroa jacobsoni TaxID=62625 RepID=UPI000BF35E6E|nr:CCAAT/enhancer-binding protein zeta-like [Varroa jacobsoni]
MNKLLVKPGTCWFEQVSNPERCNVAEQLVHKLSQQCQDQLLKDDIQHYKTYKEQSPSWNDFRWVDMVRRKGSLRDRAAAFSLLLQDSPVHNLEILDILIQWVSPKGKRECFIAIDALTDLFVHYLLPPSRKLVSFNFRPLQKLDMNKRADQTKCLVWYFESQLKTKYMRFLENIEKLSYDKTETSKSKAVKTLYMLLAEHPEQEQFLLTRLVNKFGDPMRKIAAKTAHLLSELTAKHSAMKPIVLSEVESLLFRKNIAPKAQYYALCYLSTIVLTNDEYELALKLVHIYLNFFKICVAAGEADTKLMAVLLTGVNRAFPFCSTNEELISRENEDVLFRLIYMSTLSIAIQCLTLLFQVLTKKNSGLTARFYSALYKKIQDPNMVMTHHQLMMFNLIYKAVRADKDTSRVTAFIKRMLQLCLTYPPNLACSMLLIIAHVLKERPQLLLNYPQAIQVPTKPGSLAGATADGKYTKPLKADNSDVKSDAILIYDPHTDNPLKAHARTTLCYELLALSRHFHPSVALFATEILHRTKSGVQYFGDPLKDFTTMHFLDRFVYRNPKAQSNEAHDKIFGRSHHYAPKGVRSIPVGSAMYMTKHENAIPVDEAFLFRYFVESGRRTDGTGINARVKDEDVEDLDSDEADEFLGDINNHVDMDSENGDFYSEFKDGRAKLKENENADSKSDDEYDGGNSDEYELEEGMDAESVYGNEEDTGDKNEDDKCPDDKTLCSVNHLGGTDADNEFEADDEQEEEGYKGFKPKPTIKGLPGFSLPLNVRLKKFKVSELTASTDRFQSMLDSNRGLDGSGSLHALSAKTAAGKVSDAKQLDWERKRHFQLFGKRKPKGKKLKKGKVVKKAATLKAHRNIIKFNAPKKGSKKQRGNQ